MAGLDLAARYRPAAAGEKVGGDWWDVLAVPAEHGGEAVVVTVGDITGHDIHAATLMGQVRSMTRQATWDHRGGPPSAVFTALEQACAAVATPVTGTLVHAHLTPLLDGTGDWSLRWVNAGHPQPLLRRTDGSVTPLAGTDLMFGYPDLRAAPPADREVVLEPGEVVLLYTDGLVERRHLDIDAAVDGLRRTIERLGTTEPTELVDAVLSAYGAATSMDDLVVLVVRVGDPAP